MNILITGCAGFVGSHLCERLIEDEHYIYGIDNLSNGTLENMTNINKSSFSFINNDIRRPLSDQLAHIDLIIHLAAIGSVPRSMKDPTAYMQNNVLGFHNVLEFARTRHIKTVFYASSSSVYGNSVKYYRYESDPTEPCSPYASSKLINEVMAKAYESSYWINTYGLRFFNVYGPRQKMNSEYAAVIPKFCQGILNGGKVKIFGDGRQVRTFTPVEFVCEAIAIMVSNSEHLKHQIYNVTHQDYAASVIDTARLISRIYNKHYGIEFLPDRLGDIKTSIGSGKNLMEVTGLSAQDCSTLEAMKNTCAWYKSKIISQ